MAAIAVKPVIAAVTATITAVIRRSTQAAVMAAVSKAVTQVVEAAVTSAITAAITSGITSAVSGRITETTAKAIEEALRNNLDETVKEVIGSQGLRDLSKAMSAIPSEAAVDQLAKAAIDAINPHLWVFTDPTFFRLTRLIETLRAIKQGKRPKDDEDDDDEDDDDDCDEEKCRFFKEPDVAGIADDFIFFTVFANEECQEGDEVYSMCAQWKKLKSLVDDPIGGHIVNQLFDELFENCVEEDDDEGDIEPSVLAGVAALKIQKKLVKPGYGTLVSFRNKKIHNIRGSSRDKRKSNWLKTFFALGYGKCGKCYIAKEDPSCGHTFPTQGNIVGGHVWNPALKKADKSLYFSVLPICKRHNKRSVYDDPKPDGTGWMKTTSDAFAMKITSTSDVVGWKAMVSHLRGSKPFMKMMALSKGEGEKCQEIIQPKRLTDWLLQEVHQVALEFAQGPIETVFQEVSATVLEKLNEIIKSAGSEAENWAKKEGKDIMLQSLIPFYGMYQAIKRLSSLEKDAIGRFHSGTQKALSRYKEECLGDVEQKRREQLLVEEADKVIASKEWEERMVTLEETVALKLSTFSIEDKN